MLLLMGLAAAAPSISEDMEWLQGEVEALKELEGLEGKEEEEGWYKRMPKNEREAKSKSLSGCDCYSSKDDSTKVK